jgi:hypothetical protein
VELYQRFQSLLAISKQVNSCTNIFKLRDIYLSRSFLKSEIMKEKSREELEGIKRKLFDKKTISNAPKPPKRKTPNDDFQKWGDKNPIKKTILQIADPTGISSWGDAKKTWSDGKTNSDDAWAALSVVPVLGKVSKLSKLTKASKGTERLNKVKKAAKTINNVSDVQQVTSEVDKRFKKPASKKQELTNAKKFSSNK